MENGLIVMGDLPIKNNGLIVMGDLPKGKKGKSGLIVMGDLLKKNDGLIIMGDLSKWKKRIVWRLDDMIKLEGRWGLKDALKIRQG